MSDKELTAILGCLAVPAFVFGLNAAMAAVVMWLWNALVPGLWPAAPHLTFWVTFGLLILLGIVGGTLRSSVTVKK